MNGTRALLTAAKILPDARSDALANALRRVLKTGSQFSPWSLRAAAHERLLTSDELAVALGHIARHRGFRSNSKRDAGANAVDETSKMKKAMEATREGLAKYHSFGDMIASDPKFINRKRNRDKDYSHTPKRSDLEVEIRDLFRAQRRLGNSSATGELEAQFAKVAFWQRPLQDSEQLVGPCPFEPDQKRTSRRAPSFEMFRYLSRLANLRLTVGKSERALTPEEITLAVKDFGVTKGVSFKALRKSLDLDLNTKFAGVSSEKEIGDVVARTPKAAAAAGTRILREAIGEAPWQSLIKTPEKLDRIAEILTFREDMESISKGFAQIGIEPLVLDRLMKAADAGTFNDFSGAAHVSALAARNIIPGLREGLDYSEACARVGYDHSARHAVALKDINSPVTRRAFGEAIKQVRAVVREYGPIDFFHVELARAVGKSAEERKKLTDGIETRNAEKGKRRKEASDTLGRPVSDDELMRYELAKEQMFKCVYCDAGIDGGGFAANDTRWQVDHILPWSRFGDDSYINKTLCCVACNQHKRGRTAFEWFSEDKAEKDWTDFTARFECCKEMKGRKKRNFGLKDAKAVEDKFKTRNLTDTQWATRLLADELKRMYPPRVENRSADGKDERRVFTRPGAITSKLRRAWGLESLKKENGERVSDDRHHAVDAIVLAATTEGLLQNMTKEIQKREREGRADDIFHVSQPWTGFREEVVAKVYGTNGIGGVFVSRAERRRARGKAHDATVKQIREIEGEQIVFERKAVEKLTEKDLDKIPVPEPYGKITDPKKLRDDMVEALRAWILAGKPKGEDKAPRSPKGDIIRKVRVATQDKVAVEVSGGTADRSAIVRIDIYKSGDARAKAPYCIVPIFAHQVVEGDAPSQFFELRKAYREWPQVRTSDRFLFCLQPFEYVEITTKNDELVVGYYRKFDSNDGRISITPHHTKADAAERRVSPTTIGSIKKLAVSRLGRLSEVPNEVRTWRGKVCI